MPTNLQSALNQILSHTETEDLCLLLFADIYICFTDP